MRTARSLIAVLFLFPLATPKLAADVRLPAIFGDYMVLQQDTAVTIWGWGSPGEAIEVSTTWGGSATTTADDRRRWSLRLTTPPADGRPHNVTVRGHTVVTLKDVWLGEVWLCSGQSNMEMPVGNKGGGYRGVKNYEAELENADDPGIRLFTVRNTLSAANRIDTNGQWTLCDATSAHDFSAVGFFFAQQLRKQLDVPVGVISADWGGTRVEAWMSPDAISAFERYRDDLDHLDLVRDPNRRGSFLEARRAQWWQRIDPEGLAWSDPELDDRDWTGAELPGRFGDELAVFDGVVYYRRTIDLPEGVETLAAKLHLGPIDDYDDAAINGTPVGSEHGANQWAKPRVYDVPVGTLKAGKNLIALRVLDSAGPGGVHGKPEEMRLEIDGHEPIPLAGVWSSRVGRPYADLPPQPQSAGLNKNMPTVLYRGMIHPIRPFTISGVLWYQGESNRAQPDLYRRTFPALIRDWRQQWDRDFPFYFVQIAPYAYGGDRGQTARQREAQAAALSLPKTGMAVTLDVGNPRDIHPADKQSVADRLARLALRDHYGHETIAEGPTFDRAEFRAARAVLHFDHADDLRIAERERNEFEIAGEDRVFHPARAVVRDATVVVSSEAVPKPKAVRYAWRAAPEATLFGREDLPAPPFRTDDWDDATRAKPDVRRHRTRETGFRPLFDGRSLDGWVNVNGADSTWKVKDAETIWCSGIPTGVLRTERQYENFILELEYRHLHAGGNAGVFVWSDPLTARGQPFTRSVEVQVLDGREGDWFTSDGDIFPIHGSTMTPENGRGGSRAFPTEKRAHPSPEWNHYRIECVNGRISLAVNGKVVTRGRECRPRKGYVCLESEGSPVEFRHVRLKELPSTATLGRSDSAERARDFENLYNGVNLDGWSVTPSHRESWKPKDWILDFDGQGPDLWTEESFGDFTLICDWRWSSDPVERALPVILADGTRALNADGTAQTTQVQDAGDSGIYLRGNTKSQVNIWCWPIGSGEVYGYRTDASLSDEDRAAVTPAKRADAPIGQWNRFEITLVGERLTVVLNGTTVIDRATLPGVPAEGPIGLQRHGSPIQFANIFVRRLRPRSDRF